MHNNDRFIVKDSKCFVALKSGDHVGSNQYLSVLGHLLATNVPILNEYKIKAYLFGEYIYYPPFTRD